LFTEKQLVESGKGLDQSQGQLIHGQLWLGSGIKESEGSAVGFNGFFAVVELVPRDIAALIKIHQSGVPLVELAGGLSVLSFRPRRDLGDRSQDLLEDFDA
jgi:hypothetical protein